MSLNVEQKEKRTPIVSLQDRFVYCLDCEEGIQIICSDYENYRKRKDFLINHCTHIIGQFSRRQLQEKSFYRTNKKMERLKNNGFKCRTEIK